MEPRYDGVPEHEWVSFSVIQLMVALAAVGVLMTVLLPGFIWARERAEVAGLKSNMHEVQYAIEHYATDHYGSYPRSLQDERFAWGTYVKVTVTNPFNAKVVGQANMESDVRVTNATPVKVMARNDKRSGTPGAMRYFVDQRYENYALIGYDQDKSTIKEQGGRPNFALTN